MKRIKQLLSLLLVFCMVCTLLPASALAQESEAHSFTDVHPDDWFYDAVQYASQHRMMFGTGNDRFSPNRSMTRGMLVTVLHRLNGCPTEGTMPFEDVKADKYYADAISWAAAKGLVQGLRPHYFGPEEPVTREQMAVIFYRYSQFAGCGSNASADLTVFSDAENIHDYAIPAMRWAVGTRLMNGFKDGSLQPNAVSTRAQATTILMHFHQFILFPSYEDPMTRGEWIQFLLTSCGYPDPGKGRADAYTDLSDSPYREAVERAVIYQILSPGEHEAFRANDPATRDFAGETAVNTIQYALGDPIVCKDVDQIHNPAAIRLAVELGLLYLEDGYFYPERPLIRGEADQIIRALEKEFQSTMADQEEHAGFVYLEDVQKISGEIWPENNGSVSVPEGQPIPQAEDILVFTDAKKAVKVLSVNTVDGKTTFTYQTPELYEFLDSMDLQGEAHVDAENFIPAENVTVNSIEINSHPVQTMGFMDDQFDIPKRDIAVNEDLSLDADIKINQNVTLNVNFDLGIRKVGYKFDVDFDANIFNDIPPITVKNAYVKISEDSNIKMAFTVSDSTQLPYDIAYPPYIRLGKIPLLGTNGVGIVLEVDLVLTGQGTYELTYREYGTMGVQVKNNRPKNLTSIQTDVSVGASGAMKLGIQAQMLAEVFGKHLLSFSAECGVQVSGSATVRDSGIVCLDASIAPYAELKAFENSLLDDWLSIAMKWTIFDPDDYDMARYHMENMKHVAHCTYGNDGILHGSVEKASDHSIPIADAHIEVRQMDTGEVIGSAVSKENGRYILDHVPVGDYWVHVSADGYIPFKSKETVRQGEATFVETFLMVETPQEENQTGTIGGSILNAVTGSTIPDVQISVYQGRNTTSGDALTHTVTDADGRYSLTLPVGNYTLALSCEGFVSNHINVAVTKEGGSQYNANLNPDQDSGIELGTMRIVLTWGSSPEDLDSHLKGPADDYHVWFPDMEYSDSDGNRADLDLDDRYRYGPETTTIYNMGSNGVYHFYVHNYTDYTDESSTRLAQSSAKVQVYMGESLIATYHVPTDGVGTVWHVFDFDSNTRQIQGINEFFTCEPIEIGNPC